MSALVHATCGTVDAVTPKDPHVSGWVPNFSPPDRSSNARLTVIGRLSAIKSLTLELFGTLSMMTGSLTSPS